MAKLLKLRRGTTSQHSSFTGAEGECTVDTDKETLVVHDGSTAGGHPVAAEDMANVSSASIAGRLANDSIATSKIAAGALPSDVTVASANIVDDTIVNADINSSAAIGGEKINPNFGSQNIVTTGNLSTGQTVTLSGTNPKVAFTDTNNDPDFEIYGSGGVFQIYDATNSATRFKVNSDGHVDVAGNLDCESGIDVTGIITSTGNVNTSGNINITNEGPKVSFIDSGDNPDYHIENSNGTLKIRDTTNSTNRIVVNTDGHVDIDGNLDVGAGIDVTGNANVTGNADVTGNLETNGILKVSSTVPRIVLEDTNNNDDFSIYNENGVFLIYDDTNSASRLSITSAGDTSVSGNLDVGSGVDVTGNITVSGTVDGRDVAADGTKLDGIESGATADQTGAEIASALNGNNVYIGGSNHLGFSSNDRFSNTANNHIDVQVNGSTEFRFESDGDFHADGDVIAQSTTISSDAKLKEDIELVPDALGKLNKLNGVTFTWKRSKEKSAGVIAQDVQKVLPEAVKEVTALSNGESHLSVNYHALTSILIEAVKELQAEVEKLKGGK